MTVPLEKVVVTEMVKKFPPFYETCPFFAVITRAYPWCLPWAR